jgi:hypothetical protein
MKYTQRKIEFVTLSGIHIAKLQKMGLRSLKIKKNSQDPIHFFNGLFSYDSKMEYPSILEVMFKVYCNWWFFYNQVSVCGVVICRLLVKLRSAVSERKQVGICESAKGA